MLANICGSVCITVFTDVDSEAVEADSLLLLQLKIAMLNPINIEIWSVCFIVKVLNGQVKNLTNMNLTYFFGGW